MYGYMWPGAALQVHIPLHVSCDMICIRHVGVVCILPCTRTSVCSHLHDHITAHVVALCLLHPQPRHWLPAA